MSELSFGSYAAAKPWVIDEKQARLDTEQKLHALESMKRDSVPSIVQSTQGDMQQLVAASAGIVS